LLLQGFDFFEQRMFEREPFLDPQGDLTLVVFPSPNRIDGRAQGGRSVALRQSTRAADRDEHFGSHMQRSYRWWLFPAVEWDDARSSNAEDCPRLPWMRPGI
jgi:hypothetical protein